MDKFLSVLRRTGLTTSGTVAALKECEQPLSAFVAQARHECERFAQCIENREAERSWEEREFMGPVGACIEGEQRVRLLSPYVVRRFEARESDWERTSDEARAAARLALCGLGEAGRGMMLWLEEDDLADAARVVAGAAALLHSSLEIAQAGEWPDLDDAFHAVRRLLPDVEDLAAHLADLADNRERRPDPLPPIFDEEPWTVEEWERFFDQEMAGKSDGLKYLAEHGYSRESLIEAHRVREEAYEALRRNGEEMIARHKRQAARDSVFDPNSPEAFLTLETIPESSPEAELRSLEWPVDVEEPDDEPGEVPGDQEWSESIPEVQAWENRDDEYFDDFNERERDPLGEEVFALNMKFTKRFDEEHEPGPVGHYLLELLTVAGMAATMSDHHVRQAGNIAPRIAQYRRMVRLFGEAREVVAKFPEPGLEGVEPEIATIHESAKRHLANVRSKE